ncbi:MAG: protein-L-isoaspartate(D-aspartate) O-methyltransferase [Alphaproteobacteria bacterium]|jgi:protein-L-isoaspartate(D-aspartate) O-methyltransferase|nr:protein-L-isoaspartate(D-aspartate) O-methyltransferase [Alphaproteobacteria bacterium]MDP6516670.1 protein-L-isoaspartate(D-aspartate) O-methyltransferase [Alphaproteobacteria bacterium]
MNDSDFAVLRREMIVEIKAHAGMVADETGRPYFDQTVIDALAKVPRHEFVPTEMRKYAYADSPLPIGCGKTISQPFIVALMTDLLELAPDDTVAEIGTGLGYQSAILAELADQVYTVEIFPELAEEAKHRHRKMGYRNISIRIGDGAHGWADHAPFDKIMVTAAPKLIPPALIEQLKPGGRMVIPAGIEDAQQLILVEKDPSGRSHTREILPVRFSSFVISH